MHTRGTRCLRSAVTACSPVLFTHQVTIISPGCSSLLCLPTVLVSCPPAEAGDADSPQTPSGATACTATGRVQARVRRCRSYTAAHGSCRAPPSARSVVGQMSLKTRYLRQYRNQPLSIRMDCCHCCILESRHRVGYSHHHVLLLPCKYEAYNCGG